MEDVDFNEKINEINEKLNKLCKSKGMFFVDNSNIDGTCLNKSKLHLNRKGTGALVKNMSHCINKLGSD